MYSFWKTALFLTSVVSFVESIVFGGPGPFNNYLIDVWKQHTAGPVFQNYEEFAAVYHDLFRHFGYSKINILELGVKSGGSVSTWEKWLKIAHNYHHVVLDSNPLVKQLAGADNVHIEIGSSDDISLLHSICRRFGPFDVIIDDGSHSTQATIIALRTLYPCMKSNGFYSIENTMMISHAERTGGESTLFESQTFNQHIAKLYDSMHSYWLGSVDPGVDVIFQHKIKQIHLYDGLLILERKNMKPLTLITGGDVHIPIKSHANVNISFFDDGRDSVIFETFVATKALRLTRRISPINVTISAICIIQCIRMKHMKPLALLNVLKHS